MEGLIEGRIVHYVHPSGQHLAAVVTKTWNEKGNEGKCNLAVFQHYAPYQLEGPAQLVWETGVPYSKTPTHGTWHWIEKA